MRSLFSACSGAREAFAQSSALQPATQLYWHSRSMKWNLLIVYLRSKKWNGTQIIESLKYKLRDPLAERCFHVFMFKALKFWKLVLIDHSALPGVWKSIRRVRREQESTWRALGNHWDLHCVLEIMNLGWQLWEDAFVRECRILWNSMVSFAWGNQWHKPMSE